MAARHPNHRPASTLPFELRRTSVPPHVREWVRDATGSPVVRARRLDGASSVAIHRLDLADGSRVALRRYVWRRYVESEPEAPDQEVASLKFADRNGLPVPQVIAFDTTGRQVGDYIPLILTTLLPGRPQAVPDLKPWPRLQRGYTR